MRSSRIFLFRGQHPMYETLTQFPPPGVEYYPTAKTSGMEEYGLYAPNKFFVRNLVDTSFGLIGTPRFIPVLRKYDLVHSSRGFLVLGPNNYVVDFEHASSFAGMHHERLRRSGFRNLLSKWLQSDKCRALLPHSEASLKTISLITSDRRLFDKATVLYPSTAIPPEKRMQKDDSKPTLLFMGEFYWKGGREVLRACIRLAGKMDFRLLFISTWVHPPEDEIRKAKEKISIEHIRGPVPRSELFSRIYPSVDIFVMPTYLDTFGYVYLEAMAHHLPCVGTRHYAVPEIVEDGVSGILVDPGVSYFDQSGAGHPELLVNEMSFEQTEGQLSAALETLLCSRTVRERMGNEGYKRVESGRFSIARRNSVLASLYEKHIDNRIP